MKRLTTRVPQATPKTRLDDFLEGWLPVSLGKSIPKSKVRTLIFSGAVYVNRHRNKNAAADIFGGAVIEVYYDEGKLNLPDTGATQATNPFKADQIVFEDEWLVIVNKAAGVPTQPTIDPNRANLYDQVKKNRPYLGLHHRLDRDTSGLVLFTKKEEANKGVADLFTEHRIQKSYQCLVMKTPVAPEYDVHETFLVKNYLGRISEKSDKAKYGSVKSGGDPAHTDFRVLEKFREAYWLEAKPKTGRTHQIRVHTSELGLPILGDPMYFPKNVFTLIKAPRLMLHAFQLEFEHPISRKAMKIEATLPEDFLKVLASIRA